MSIITAAFNAAPFLPRLIHSLKIQGYAPIEWVIVDDGSTDGTGDLVLSAVDELQKFGVTVKYRRQSNEGQAAATHKALQMATGEFVCLIDADDWFAKDGIGRMVTALGVNPEAKIVCARHVHVSRAGRIVGVQSRSGLPLSDPVNDFFGGRFPLVPYLARSTALDKVIGANRERFHVSRFGQNVQVLVPLLMGGGIVDLPEVTKFVLANPSSHSRLSVSLEQELERVSGWRDICLVVMKQLDSPTSAALRRSIHISYERWRLAIFYKYSDYEAARECLSFLADAGEDTVRLRARVWLTKYRLNGLAEGIKRAISPLFDGARSQLVYRDVRRQYRASIE